MGSAESVVIVIIDLLSKQKEFVRGSNAGIAVKITGMRLSTYKAQCGGGVPMPRWVR